MAPTFCVVIGTEPPRRVRSQTAHNFGQGSCAIRVGEDGTSRPARLDGTAPRCTRPGGSRRRPTKILGRAVRHLEPAALRAYRVVCRACAATTRTAGSNGLAAPADPCAASGEKPRPQPGSAAKDVGFLEPWQRFGVPSGGGWRTFRASSATTDIGVRPDIRARTLSTARGGGCATTRTIVPREPCRQGRSSPRVVARRAKATRLRCRVPLGQRTTRRGFPDQIEFHRAGSRPGPRASPPSNPARVSPARYRPGEFSSSTLGRKP